MLYFCHTQFASIINELKQQEYFTQGIMA